MAYSGQTFVPQAWHPALVEIKALLEATLGAKFNSVLVNCYRDGQDSVSWHADDEPELGYSPCIASVSLGANRRFSIKPRRKMTQSPNRELGRAGHVKHMELGDGDLLVMSGAMQRYWHHCIPKTSRLVGQRINLTYRYIYTRDN